MFTLLVALTISAPPQFPSPPQAPTASVDCSCGCDCGCESCPANCSTCEHGSRGEQQIVSAPVRVYSVGGYTRTVYAPAPVYYYYSAPQPVVQSRPVYRFVPATPTRYVPQRVVTTNCGPGG